MDHGTICIRERSVQSAMGRSRHQPCAHFFVMVTLLVLGLLFPDCRIMTDGTAAASPSSGKKLAIKSLRQLETEVWMAHSVDWSRLEREISRHIQLQPNSALAHAIYAHLLLRQFSRSPDNLYLIKNASEMAQQSVDLDPTNEVGFVVIADVLDVMSQNKKALSLLKQAINKGLNAGWRTHFTIARLSTDSEPLEVVLTHLEKARSAPNVIADIVDSYVIAVLRSLRQGQDLEDDLIQWNNRFPSSLFQNSIAISMAERGQFNASHKLYQEILKTDPSSIETIINDGLLLYRHLNQPKKARELLKRALSLEELNTEKKFTSIILLHLANIELALANSKEATSLYLRSVKVSSDPTSSVIALSRSLREQGDIKKLGEVFASLSQKMTHVAMVHALYGELLSEDLQQHDLAIDSFENALLLEPERSDFYNGLGLTYYRMTNLSKALHYFSTAVQVNPSDAIARYNEACVLARIGKISDALDSLREAVSLDPKLIDTARADLDFASVRSQPDFLKMMNQIIDEPLIDQAEDLMLGH